MQKTSPGRRKQGLQWQLFKPKSEEGPSRGEACSLPAAVLQGLIPHDSRLRPKTHSQHHIGVLKQDAPLAAGVNAKPSAGIADVDPDVSSRPFVQDADRRIRNDQQKKDLDPAPPLHVRR